jgi:predicted O-methyltransferase YrrM
LSHVPKQAAAWLIVLLAIPTVAWAQAAADSREKSEKVSDILAALQAEPGKQIADVGAGEGFYSLRIARAVGPSGRVTAVDVSETYLEKLRARLKQDNVTNVDVVVGAEDDPRLRASTSTRRRLRRNCFTTVERAPASGFDLHAGAPA